MTPVRYDEVCGHVLRIVHPRTGIPVQGIGWIVCDFFGDGPSGIVTVVSLPVGTVSQEYWNTVKRRLVRGDLVVTADVAAGAV